MSKIENCQESKPRVSEFNYTILFSTVYRVIFDTFFSPSSHFQTVSPSREFGKIQLEIEILSNSNKQSYLLKFCFYFN